MKTISMILVIFAFFTKGIYAQDTINLSLGDKGVIIETQACLVVVQNLNTGKFLIGSRQKEKSGEYKYELTGGFESAFIFLTADRRYAVIGQKSDRTYQINTFFNKKMYSGEGTGIVQPLNDYSGMDKTFLLFEELNDYRGDSWFIGKFYRNKKDKSFTAALKVGGDGRAPEETKKAKIVDNDLYRGRANQKTAELSLKFSSGSSYMILPNDPKRVEFGTEYISFNSH